ncbi:N-acetylmuramic acid 6-phosphate etherase [Niabella beijingensis]|uniref:N-acetylmuramic acid 6-phosphate etherase n=1 Tax=Niabella beijingensis TaxID=2872700 RepID=UPI001CBB2F38|nr:N-acetylmuramic acid 6-phosphate etherase [Niabella beijingensis]MBZ4188868.1 N-acetylmuramic acid 6-phosphate etherase [Niabella beijingensis]
MNRITEQPSLYNNLENRSVEELVTWINQEDAKVAGAIEKALPQVTELIKEIVRTLKGGGRMFYLGAGSGGRLSVLDAIELPTTYGIEPDRVNVILAGGVDKLVLALEEKEDDVADALEQIRKAGISANDFVLGISASGTTPFVLAGLKEAGRLGAGTGCIVSNPGSPVAAQAKWPVEVITGPEFITGSTRMKCGTAQKMLFDMISTTVMIRLGRVEDNSMVNVKLINDKITDRAVKILMKKAGIDNYEEAKALLLSNGSVKKALLQLREGSKQ